MKNIIVQSNFPVLMLILFISYAIYVGISLHMSILIGLSIILFGFKLWLDHIKKPDPIPNYNQKLVEMEKNFSIKLKNCEELVNIRMEQTENKLGALSLQAKNGPVKKPQQQFGW